MRKLTTEARPLAGLRVLAVSTVPTHPPIAGNRVRVLALLNRLEKLGATVRLLRIDHERGDMPQMREHWKRGGAVELPYKHPVPRYERWNNLAEKLHRRLHIPVRPRADVDDWCDRANKEAIEREVQSFRPHAIYMVYLWHSSLLESLPPTVCRVLDAHDVFTDRNERMARAGVPQQWYSVPKREERRGLDRFDYILAIQEHEAEYYRSLTRRTVVTVGHLLSIVDVGPPVAAPEVLMVGSDNVINVDGFSWFIDAVWPFVMNQLPQARLNVVGGVCAQLSPATGVVLVGNVPDVTAFYASSALVANPVRDGTGLKIKGAEALAAGRVVVSTPSAAKGLERAVGSGVVVATTAIEMAGAIVQLLRDHAELVRLSARATEFALEWNRCYEVAFDGVFLNLTRA